MSRFDVLVSGAGVAGAVTALGLSRAGLSVGLIEQRVPEPYAGPVLNQRVVALAPGSVRVLRQLGIWPLPEPAATAYARMQVLAGSQQLDFDAVSIGASTLGWITDLEALQRQCWSALQGTVRVYAPARIAQVDRRRDEVTVDLENGPRLRASLLVIAEGGRSSLREAMGFSVQVHDYRARALVAQVTTEFPNRGIAFQRFATGGPLAFLPLHDGRSSMVWTRPQETAEQWLGAEQDRLIAALNDASERRFGAVLAVSKLSAYPLQQVMAERFAEDRVALVGDSAHVVHPLAGLGLNLGLMDVAALIELVSKAQRIGRDPGSVGTLARYRAWREGDTQIAAQLVDGIERVFTAQASLAQDLLAKGMGALNVLPLLKDFFVAQATGASGRIPELARNQHGQWS